YDAVRRYPGLHLRGLERQVGVSAALAQYHLRRLEEAGFIESREQGGYVRFFAREETAPRLTDADLEIVGLLREEVPLHVVLLLLDHGPLAHAEIVEKAGVAKSTVSYHLAKLAVAGVVDRAEGGRVTLVDRDRIYRLLLAYDPTPDMRDAFADLWEDLYG
ncbi:MAG TPA: ArsR family transcriptional regulator, partial [Candidatus Thermoplasmatota archaeon]|nr:ArsR family transcriptional regulator [Candidatus Thermoplasmatota archaeon]